MKIKSMGNKGNTLVIFLAIVATLSLAAAAYFYGRSQNLISGLGVGEKNSIEVPLETEATYESFNSPQTLKSSTSPTPQSSAVVVFEAEGSFSKTEKDEIMKKIVNPFVDYYEMEQTGQILLTLTLSKNDKASKDTYPYQAEAVFKGGGNMGFLIMKSGTGVDWWFPECLNGCSLSAVYKAKYPEVSAKVQ